MLAVAERLARWLSWIAGVGLLWMVAVNVADVAMRSGLNAPIFGAYELVEVGLAACGFLAIPETFLRGGHIKIEMIEAVIPAGAVRALDGIGAVATLGFLVLLLWNMVQPALDMIAYNEVTFDLHLPVIVNASLVLLGLASSLIVVVIVMFRGELREEKGDIAV
jgi:TRAP-type C4-dicarboxylate transport system permease small subunit